MNLVEYLARATEYLERNGVSSPRLNAELLLGEMLGITRLDIYTGFERLLSAEESERYRGLLLRRASGVPLQYLTGSVGFLDLELEVREGVFIPRPETEVLVDKALEVLGEGPAPVLDIGTGCGNIAVAVARRRRQARVTATDIDPLALEVCRRNARAHGVADRVSTLEGDLFTALPEGAPPFGLLVSNPPYIPSGCAGALPPEVVEHEPERALFAGTDGLDVIGRIVEGAPQHLREGGWIALEVDEGHAGEVEGLLAGDWSDVEVFEDLAGRPRVVRARRS